MGGQAEGRAARIRRALEPLGATEIGVIDDSARHAGHAGARPGDETHYSVRIVSASFAGRSRVARHRRVNDLLAAEFEAGLHALSLVLLTPDEAAR